MSNWHVRWNESPGTDTTRAQVFQVFCFTFPNSFPKIRGEINQRVEEGLLWGKKKNHMRDRSLYRCKRQLQRSGASPPLSDGKAMNLNGKRTRSQVKEDMFPSEGGHVPKWKRTCSQAILGKVSKEWKLEPVACGNSFKIIGGTTPCQE